MARAVVVLAVVAVATTIARLAHSAPTHHFRDSVALACGVERWNVKTLKDRPHLLRAQPTTVAHLVSLPAPRTLPQTRLPFEYHVFRVAAAVTLNRLESDQD